MGSFKNRLRYDLSQHYMLYLMALPAVICLILFSYVPMFGLLLAFKEYNVADGIFGSPWVGLRNFTYLFSSTETWVITRNTVLYNAVFIALNTILSIAIALLLSELHSRRMAKIFQTIFIMPHFLSMAIVAIIVYAFLSANSGLVNSIRKACGLSRVNWYNQVSIWPVLLVAINAWKHVGYKAVVYLAAITGISTEYYEAALLDGATKMQQIRYITLPHLRSIVSILLIMSIGNMFSGDFGLFYTVTQDSGMLYPVTNVIDTYVYRAMITMNDISRSSAASFYQSIVGLILVLISNGIVRKVDPDNSLF